MKNITTVTKDNIDEHGMFCLGNKKAEGFTAKYDWLEKRFKEGLVIKLVKDENGKNESFIEYIPGEYAWRTVNAENYMFIHCVYSTKKEIRNKGNVSLLINECIDEADAKGMAGVAVITSDGAWLADRQIFEKNGFKEIATAPPYFQLMVKKLKEGKLPSFNEGWNKRLKKFKGMNIIYSNQCPYHIKSAYEISEYCAQFGIDVNIKEITTAKQAQKAPTPFGAFWIVYEGKLVADHYVSKGRMKNILSRELKLI
jgi:L-amino acid N-acyltransferase YncA